MIATVIVGYKNEQLTISYVKDELSKIGTDNLVVIVNNEGSSISDSILSESLSGEIITDIEENISDRGKKCYVINSSENLGFAKGNNLGFQFVRRHFPEIEFVLFSNNDIRILDDNVVTVMIDTLKSSRDIGIVTPNIIGIDGRRQTPQPYPSLYKNIFISLRSLIMSRGTRRYADSAKEGYHYTFSECFFLARAQDFYDCGMFDPFTFLFAEGLCLSERMLRINRRYYFVPDVTVVHENSTTTRKVYSWNRIRRMMTRSNNYYYKHYRGYSFVSIAINYCYCEFLCMLASLKSFFR